MADNDQIQQQQRDQAAISDGEAVERTGRAGEVTGEETSPNETASKAENAEGVPDPNDLTGPAGDPVEGKRPGGSTYPA